MSRRRTSATTRTPRPRGARLLARHVRARRAPARRCARWPARRKSRRRTTRGTSAARRRLRAGRGSAFGNGTPGSARRGSAVAAATAEARLLQIGRQDRQRVEIAAPPIEQLAERITRDDHAGNAAEHSTPRRRTQRRRRRVPRHQPSAATSVVSSATAIPSTSKPTSHHGADLGQHRRDLRQVLAVPIEVHGPAVQRRRRDLRVATDQRARA